MIGLPKLAARRLVAAIVHWLLGGHHKQPIRVWKHFFARLLRVIHLTGEFERWGVVLRVCCSRHIQRLHFWVLFLAHRTVCWVDMCMVPVCWHRLIASISRLWAIFEDNLLVSCLARQCSLVNLLTVLGEARLRTLNRDKARPNPPLDNFRPRVLSLRALCQPFEFRLNASLDTF